MEYHVLRETCLNVWMVHDLAANRPTSIYPGMAPSPHQQATQYGEKRNDRGAMSRTDAELTYDVDTDTLVIPFNGLFCKHGILPMHRKSSYGDNLYCFYQITSTD
jgi:hypothetical protein